MMSDRRLKSLRRRFKAVWKGMDRRGVVIEMPHAVRKDGVMVTRGLFDRLTDAFERGWLAGQNTFQIWHSVVRDFPQADQIDLEYAAKFANRRIREAMNRGRKKKPHVCRSAMWNGDSAA